MEKMRFESVDGFQENIRRLADIFPSCVKEQKDNEGKTIRKVDINTLQLLLAIKRKAKHANFHGSESGKP